MNTRTTSNSTPLREESEDDFLAGRITATQYLEQVKSIAAKTVAAEQTQVTAEQRRLDILSQRLIRLFRVIFLLVAPLVYILVGITQISTGASTMIGVLSIATGVAISVTTATRKRYLDHREPHY